MRHWHSLTKGRWVVSPVRNDPDLDMVTFRLLGDLFLRHAGLQMADESREMVARKLAGRLPMVRVDGYPEYYRYLRFHPAEMDHAIEAITTKETYLFRESAQLDGFEREVLLGFTVPPRPKGANDCLCGARAARRAKRSTPSHRSLKKPVFFMTGT